METQMHTSKMNTMTINESTQYNPQTSPLAFLAECVTNGDAQRQNASICYTNEENSKQSMQSHVSMKHSAAQSSTHEVYFIVPGIIPRIVATAKQKTPQTSTKVSDDDIQCDVLGLHTILQTQNVRKRARNVEIIQKDVYKKRAATTTRNLLSNNPQSTVKKELEAIMTIHQAMQAKLLAYNTEKDIERSMCASLQQINKAVVIYINKLYQCLNNFHYKECNKIKNNCNMSIQNIQGLIQNAIELGIDGLNIPLSQMKNCYTRINFCVETIKSHHNTIIMLQNKS